MLSSPTQWLAPFALARIVLLINHVVGSEPQATERLQAHAGRVIDIRWDTAGAGMIATLVAPQPMRLLITPAGLFEAIADGTSTPTADQGLTLTIQLGDPLDLLKRAARGERPEVSIEGQANLAEVISWLMNNLRWDIQDDVARFLGNTPAEALRKIGESLREALQRWRPGSGPNR
jgi:ubiquinone biosynthesis protein UbiJ